MSDADKPDAFKSMMAAARASGRPELANQSLGRPLTADESDLADALMAIYAAGATGPAALADALNAQGVAVPSTGAAGGWSADSLAAELRTLNDALDAAYQKNGFGA